MLGNKEIMAKNIKKYMELNNVNSTEICSSLGFKQSTFSNWINAKIYPRIDKIEKMANYFHISKSDLVEDSDLPNADQEKISNIYHAIDNLDVNQLFDVFEYTYNKMEEVFGTNFIDNFEKGITRLKYGFSENSTLTKQLKVSNDIIANSPIIREMKEQLAGIIEELGIKRGDQLWEFEEEDMSKEENITYGDKEKKEA